MIFTEEQTDLQSVIREFMKAGSTTERTLEIIEAGNAMDAQLWYRIVNELDLTSLMIDERLGGAGASLAECCIALQECGAFLAPVPLLSAAWAAAALSAATGDVAEDHLTQIVLGKTYAFAQPTTAAAWTNPTLEVLEGDLVAGTISQVAAGADAVVALAQAKEGVRIAVLDIEDLETHRLRTFDPTRPQISVVIDSRPADLIPIDVATLSSVRDYCHVMAGAESVGVMRHAVSALIEYSQERFAFGRPIGSYQALKHQLVDHWVAFECAQAAVMNALTTDDPDDFAVTAALIRHSVLTSAAAVATDIVRLYGGIGYTWEHHAHLYCKRAISNSVLFGPAHEGRQQLAARLRIGES